MSRGHDLVKILKKSTVDTVNYGQPADILFATVISVSPLTVETDQKLILPSEFLVLGRNVTDFQTYLSFDNPNIKQKVQFYNKAEKESQSEPLLKAIRPGEEPHELRPDDIPPPEEANITDIRFLKKWYENTLQLEDETGNIPEKIELPAFHEISIYNHLNVGERVIMVKEKGGQRYFIIDRVGIMTNAERGQA